MHSYKACYFTFETASYKPEVSRLQFLHNTSRLANIFTIKEDATMVDVIHTDGYCKQRTYRTLEISSHLELSRYQQPGASKTMAGSHSHVTDLFTWSAVSPIRKNSLVGQCSLFCIRTFEKPIEETHTVPYNAIKHAKRGLLYNLKTN